MQGNYCLSGLLFGLLVMSVFVFSGCGDGEPSQDSKASSPALASAKVDHSHAGWWCVEHGVPEGECALCDSSLVSKFKEAGDWCEEHKRPESQCFICSPARFNKFAARYEAKTGNKPPQPELEK